MSRSGVALQSMQNGCPELDMCFSRADSTGFQNRRSEISGAERYSRSGFVRLSDSSDTRARMDSQDLFYTDVVSSGASVF